MLTYIVIGFVIYVLYLMVKSTENSKSKMLKKPNDVVPTSEFIKRTEDSIASSNALLDENRAAEKIKTVNESKEQDLYSGGYEEFEITGVHIPERKNYILNYCAEYDAVALQHEKNNPYSDRALMIKHQGRCIGYIAEHDLDEVHELILKPYTAHISVIDYDGNYLSVTVGLDYEDKAGG